jgi:hypothetical protein
MLPKNFAEPKSRASPFWVIDLHTRSIYEAPTASAGDLKGIPMKNLRLRTALVMLAPLVAGGVQSTPTMAGETQLPNLIQLAEKAPSKAEATKLTREAEAKLRAAASRLQDNKRFREAVASH